MKGFTMLGVGCVLFLATMVSADAAQETLENNTACDGDAIGCPVGNPNDFVECFSNASLAPPYQLTEATFGITSITQDAGPLNLVVYEWSGAGQPGAIIATVQLSAADSTAGDHTVVLDPSVPLTTPEFCVGVNGDNPNGWFSLLNSYTKLAATSWVKGSACGFSEFVELSEVTNISNWCMTATIAQEDLDTSIEVNIDIKFCSDPNAYNCKKNGVLPVTIFGTDSFDVTNLDVSTLRLCLEDLTTCTGAPRDWSSSDRGDPNQDLGAEMCAIKPDTGMEEDFLTQDGFLDLDVTFEASEVKDTLLVDVCDQPRGTVSPTLFIVGTTFGGDTIYSLPLDDVAIDQLVKKNR